MKRMYFAAAALGAALLALAGSPTAAAEKALGLFGKDPGTGKAYACFVRRYDKAHLAVHPKQNVVDMTLLVDSYVDGDFGRQYTLQIGVHFRKQPKLFQVTGGCGSYENTGDALNCGVDCDGGSISVQIRDANSIRVLIPDGARTWDPESDGENDPPESARFGTDDTIFRLDRTALSDCIPVAVDDETKAVLNTPTK